MKKNYAPGSNIFYLKLSFFAISAMLFFGQTVLAQSCPGETAAHYKMDEATGATSFDDFANNNDGTCTDCPTATTGQIGGALEFNGVDQFINVPASAQFDFAASFSIEAWIKFSTSAADNKVVVSRTNNDDETPGGQGMLWWLGIDQTTNFAKFVVRDNAAVPVESETVGSTALNDGNWHQIVGTYDETANRIKIYVDGVQEDFTTVSFSNGFAAPGKPLRIGNFRFSDVTANSNFFEGAIDNIGIFNRNLCDTELGCPTNEVLNHYNNGVAGTGICPVAPGITSSPPTTASVGAEYSYQVVATGDPAPTYSLTTSPAAMSINTNTGLITWTPLQADIGTANVTVVATNSQGSDNDSFMITVTAQNDPPTFDNLGNQTVDEDAGPQTVTGWATNIDDGDPELDQNVTFNITSNDNVGLFAVAPAISDTGVLTYTANDNANGVANITVTLDDDGSPSQSSTPVNFSITVNAQNDAPTFAISSDTETHDEDFTATIEITVTPDPVPSDENTQVVTYSISPDNTDIADVSISANSGLVTINALANANGTQEFTITANDGQASNNTATQTFTLTVNAINDAPEFTLSETDITEDPDFSPVLVEVTEAAVPADESGQTVIYSISPETVTFADITISPTSGTVTIVPSTAGGGGTQEFAVTANDGQSQNNTFVQSFTFTVSGPNGLGDSEFAKSLTVFPIPAGSDQVTLRMENDYIGAVAVKIYDMRGKMVKGFDTVKNTQQYRQELNVGDIQRGTYFVHVILDKDVILERLLKN